MIIVSAVLKTCSSVCDLAVALTFCLPLKYPLITEAIATKNIAGDKATIVISASGIWSHCFEITPAPKNNNKLPINPITEKVANAILNILWAPLWSPTATLSDTNLEIAFGTPIEEIVSNIAYIW